MPLCDCVHSIGIYYSVRPACSRALLLPIQGVSTLHYIPDTYLSITTTDVIIAPTPGKGSSNCRVRVACVSSKCATASLQSARYKGCNINYLLFCSELPLRYSRMVCLAPIYNGGAAVQCATVCGGGRLPPANSAWPRRRTAACRQLTVLQAAQESEVLRQAYNATYCNSFVTTRRGRQSCTPMQNKWQSCTVHAISA